MTPAAWARPGQTRASAQGLRACTCPTFKASPAQTKAASSSPFPYTCPDGASREPSGLPQLGNSQLTEEAWVRILPPSWQLCAPGASPSSHERACLAHTGLRAGWWPGPVPHTARSLGWAAPPSDECPRPLRPLALAPPYAPGSPAEAEAHPVGVLLAERAACEPAKLPRRLQIGAFLPRFCFSS